jgi:DNA-binding transcriptional LysR family regulator
MDRLDELRDFTSILEAGSLAAAARQLRRSPPAVTRSLATLEERAGVRLIQRTTRQLSATEAGRRLASRARELLANYAQALNPVTERAEAPLQGLLRVTAPITFGSWHITPLVASFLDAHPAMRVELVLSNANVDLIRERFDVAVRIGPLSDSRLVARRVGHVRRVLCASPDYLARHGRPRTPKDLRKHDIIAGGPPRPSGFIWRFRAAGKDHQLRVTSRLILTEPLAMLVALRSGHGIGRALSYQVADDLSSGRLVRVLREFELPARPVQLVVPTARHMPPGVRAFLDHAEQVLDQLAVIHDER